MNNTNPPKTCNYLVERQFLAAQWALPAEMLDIAIAHRLSGRDFLGDGHSCLFTYLCAIALSRRDPCPDEVLALSRNVCGELSSQSLAVITHHPVNPSDLAYYAVDLRQLADDRTTEETRQLVLAGMREWAAFQQWLKRGGMNAKRHKDVLDGEARSNHRELGRRGTRSRGVAVAWPSRSRQS